MTAGEPTLNRIKRDEKGRIVEGSAPLNPDGRTEGSISVISRLKKEFREHPEKFDEFLKRYLKNPQNEKHITEMIDGKPSQSIDHTSQGEKLEIIGIVIQTPNEKEDSSTTES